MLKKTYFLTLLLLCGLFLPQRTYTDNSSLTDLIITNVIILSISKGLDWLTKEECKCPVQALEHIHPCPLSYFKTLTTASETFVVNLKKMHDMDPENPEILNLLLQGVVLHKKMKLRLEEAEALSEEQRAIFRLMQEHNFTERDVKTLALIKAREYKDVPQDLLWQAKKDEFIEVSPGIHVAKNFMHQNNPTR